MKFSALADSKSKCPPGKMLIAFDLTKLCLFCRRSFFPSTCFIKPEKAAYSPGAAVFRQLPHCPGESAEIR